MRLISIGRRIARAWQIRDYDRQHKATAHRAYQALIASAPDRALDDPTERVVVDYSRTLLGSIRFAPWLRYYSAVQGRFIEGWIPDNYFGRVVLARLQNRNSRRLTGAKTLFRRNLGTDLVPDIASFVRGSWIDRDGRPMSQEAIPSKLFEENDHVIVKFDRSARSEGVRRLSRTEFKINELSNLGDFVVQEPIRPAAELAAVTCDSLATVRITTVKPFGAPAQMRAAFVRFGRTGEDIVHANTEVEVAIVDGKGTLGEIGLMPDWSLTELHPDTGAIFKGLRVPSYAEITEICCDLHNRVPHLLIIGWDVAVDQNHRVRLLEWNLGHMEINVTEALLGPCFKGLGWDTLHSADPINPNGG